jgi:hypothetical protein
MTKRPLVLLPALVVVGGGAACDRPTKPAPVTTPASATAPIAPAAPSSSAPSAPPASDAAAPIGAPPPDFEAVVGDWSVGEAGGARGVMVDGTQWRQGTPSVSLADQAKRLYGDRYAEFLDGVKAYAFFPLAVWKNDPPKGDARLSVRFYPMSGKIDQAAGIAFAIEPDGSYLGVRANALEDNLLYFRVVKGRRTIIDTIRDVPTPTKRWHTLVVELRGKELRVVLDGEKRLEKALDRAPQGRVGLWSKADSRVLFDRFEVAPL